MKSDQDRGRRNPEDQRRRDYPEVQFTLVGDENLSPEEMEREVQRIIKKRDLAILLSELGFEEPDTDRKPDPAE